MINLILLSFFLMLLTVLSYVLNDSDAINPASLFCVGFLVCGLFALTGTSVWNYRASGSVIFTITFGVGLFVLVTFFVHILMRRSGKENGRCRDWVLPISKKALVFFLIIQAATLVLTLRAITQMYPAGDPLASISLYDRASKFTAEGADPLPFPVGPLRSLSTCIAYYVCYLLGQSLAMKDKRCRLLLLLSFVMALLVSMETGSRGGAVSFIVFVFVDYLIVRRKWLSTRYSIPLKAFVIAVVGFVVIVGTFQSALGLMGRSSTTDYWNYVLMYVGAEIPNLDLFLASPHGQVPLFGYTTFYTSINWLGKHLGIASYVYQIDLPFRMMNGVSLGNVYTTFYAFIYDFGYLGLIVLVPLMAFISTWVYERAVRFDSGRSSCIWVILYSVIANALIMSFFSNKFFENIFCINMARNLVLLLFVHVLYLLVSGKLPIRWRAYTAQARSGVIR